MCYFLSSQRKLDLYNHSLLLLLVPLTSAVCHLQSSQQRHPARASTPSTSGARRWPRPQRALRHPTALLMMVLLLPPLLFLPSAELIYVAVSLYTWNTSYSNVGRSWCGRDMVGSEDSSTFTLNLKTITCLLCYSASQSVSPTVWPLKSPAAGKPGRPSHRYSKY